jgi:hypothetical protein
MLFLYIYYIVPPILSSLQKHGQGPLYYAAKTRRSEALALLLEWGADVEQHAVSQVKSIHMSSQFISQDKCFAGD